MSDPCNHDTVTRGSIDVSGMEDFGPIWTCTECADQFAPVEVIQRIESENDRIIDMVTGVFTATLWGLHEQSKAKSLDVQPEDAQAVAEALCDQEGHKRDSDGVCTRCGNSPFLG